MNEIVAPTTVALQIEFLCICLLVFLEESVTILSLASLKLIL